MALGKVAYNNYAQTAVLADEGSGWTSLDNLKQTERFVSRPARYARVLGNGLSLIANIDVELDRARTIDLVALLFHDLSLSARVRVGWSLGEIGEPGYSFTQGDWIDVHRVYETDDQDWLAPSFWVGELGEGTLYPFHFFAALDDVVADKLTIQIDDDASAADHFDIGSLWITRCWSPAINFERGRSPEVLARDLTEEAPAGRLFSESRAPRRRLDLTWKRLTDVEAGQAFDMGAFATTRRPVLVLPDIDDAATTARESFPAIFDPPPRPTITYSGLNEIEAGFREIIA